jgi:hypothetical protein
MQPPPQKKKKLNYSIFHDKEHLSQGKLTFKTIRKIIDF